MLLVSASSGRLIPLDQMKVTPIRSAVGARLQSRGIAECLAGTLAIASSCALVHMPGLRKGQGLPAGGL